MNFMRVDKAALASSCDGGEDGEGEGKLLALPMLGLTLVPILGLIVEGGAIERGLGFDAGVALVVLVRE